MSTLQNLEIDLEGIGETLSRNRLAVPIYQRSYAWEESHVRDLLQDIGHAIKTGQKEYFVGSVVTTHADGDRLQVVDGQQRLATITIFLAAIRNYFEHEEDANRAADIERDYLFSRILRTQETIPHLQLNEVDNEYFLQNILTKPSSTGNQVKENKESHGRIKIAQEISNEIVTSITSKSSKPFDRIADWVEYIRDHVKIISVKVPTESDAFTIFETLNDRGLPLTISDLLKNSLFGLSEDRIDETQQRWVAMSSIIESAGSEELVVDYVRHLWSSRRGATRERDLYDEIKKSINIKQNAIDFSIELEDNAPFYAALLNPSHDYWTKIGTTSRQHIATINLLGMVQIRPLLLSVLSEFSVPEARKSLKLFVSWGVRFLISGGLGGGTLEKHYAQRAVEIHDKKIKNTKTLMLAMSKVVPTDTQFSTAAETMSVSKSNLARYYLRVLENTQCNKSEHELIPNPNQDEVNLEHILPQKPSNAWLKFDADQAKTFYRRLGNLAIMATKPNVAAGNDAFSLKKEFYKESDFHLTSMLAKYRDWGPKEIGDRQKNLRNLLF